MAECLAGPDSRNFLDVPISELVEAGTMALVYNNDNNKDKVEEVLGIGGVYKDCIWMLCTTHVENHKIAFLRYMRALIPIIRRTNRNPTYNHVWKFNKLHVDWLKSLDAKFYKERNGFLFFYWPPLSKD